MTNDDPEYVRDLERSVEAAEAEIKYLHSRIGELEGELTSYRNQEAASLIAQAEGRKCGCCHD